MVLIDFIDTFKFFKSFKNNMRKKYPIKGGGGCFQCVDFRQFNHRGRVAMVMS